MRLAQPAWLFLIPAVLAAGWLARRALSRRRATLVFPEAAQAAAAEPSSMALDMTPFLFKTVSLVLIVVALARPQLVERRFGGPAQGIDIILALDTSQSMLALDFDPADRITAAKETAKRFIQGRVQDRIGLVVFGGAPIVACPLTLDSEALLDFLENIQAGMTRTEGTAIGDGLVAAVDSLRPSPAKSKVIVLLTDGANNAGAIDPITAAKTAASFGIKVHAIGTGKRGETLLPVDTPMGRQLARIPDELDEESLLKIAAETDGKYFRATNVKELSGIFADIDRMETTEIAKPVVTSATDLYAWFVLPALFLLLSEAALARTLLLRIP
ncbi:MAG: VWA domain-containing protein [Elusimicrobia bacterium]|nr:VWA domain-containing protein [Elusimicrobiota bacterium]